MVRSAPPTGCRSRIRGGRFRSLVKNRSDGHGWRISIEIVGSLVHRLGGARQPGRHRRVLDLCRHHLQELPQSGSQQYGPQCPLRRVRQARVAGAYENKAQKDEAVETLVAKYQENKEPIAIRAVIIRSLGTLGDQRARHTVIKAVNDPEAVIRVEGCRALGKVGIPEDATILARIMTVDTLEDCRVAAIEGLGWLKSNDPRINRILLEGMDHDDPAIRYECLNVLRRITGKDLGVDPAPCAELLEPGPERQPPATKSSPASSAAQVGSASTGKQP